MASIEFLQKRIAGKEKEIATLEKKLARIYKAQESNWEQNNPYYYNEYDLKRTLRELEDAQAGLEKYQAELSMEEEKSNSRDVQVILDFLEDWKEHVFDFYGEGLQKMFADRAEVKALWVQQNSAEYGSEEYKELREQIKILDAELKAKMYGEFEDIPKDDPSYRRFYNEKRKIATGEYEYLKEYFKYTSLAEALEALKKLLDREAELKYDDIIERTNAIVGQITDASYLTIGAKGDLNGFIIGTRGKAEVNTIGAGGYNIQCYHFRTLIKKMK